MQRTVLACCAVAGGGAASAHAATITFTHAVTASGTLGRTAFVDAEIVITAIGDTDDREDLSGIGWFIDHTSVTVSIGEIGSFDLLSSTRTFVNNGGSVVGLARAGGPVEPTLLTGPTDGVFADWDMTTEIESVTGLGQVSQWSVPGLDDVETTGGALVLEPRFTNVAFSAVIPAPGPVAIGAVALLGGAVRRRRGRR